MNCPKKEKKEDKSSYLRWQVARRARANKGRLCSHYQWHETDRQTIPAALSPELKTKALGESSAFLNIMFILQKSCFWAETVNSVCACVCVPVSLYMNESSGNDPTLRGRLTWRAGGRDYLASVSLPAPQRAVHITELFVPNVTPLRGRGLLVFCRPTTLHQNFTSASSSLERPHLKSLMFDAPQIKERVNCRSSVFPPHVFSFISVASCCMWPTQTAFVVTSEVLLKLIWAWNSSISGALQMQPDGLLLKTFMLDIRLGFSFFPSCTSYWEQQIIFL